MDPAKPPGNETTYVWEIENFNMCPLIKGEYLKSTPFYVDSMDVSEYQLMVYPRGNLHDKDDTVIYLMQCLKESDFHLNITMTITFDDQQFENKADNVLMTAGMLQGFPIEVTREPPTEPGRFALLPADLLTLRVAITPLYRDPEANDEDLKTLSEDLGRLHQMGLFSDFCLIARGERKFPVHKVILTTRCPTLAKNVGICDGEDCKEALMDDVTGEAMEVFLHYVYTGRLRENLPSEVLNEVYTLADRCGMDDLKRDLFPMELCTVGRTIIKTDHHDITWDLVDFHQRVESGEWPVRTFLDLIIGRFVASFHLVVDDGGKFVAQVDLKCQCLNLDDSLTMKCSVQAFAAGEEPWEALCSGEHQFDAKNLDQLFVLSGDYKYRSAKEFPGRVALKLCLKVSHPRYLSQCTNREVISALYTPIPFGKRSLYRLSSDLDLVFKNTTEEGDDKSRTFSDLKLIVGDSRHTAIPAHRCILSARSGHLMSKIIGNAFSGPTAEIPEAIPRADYLRRILRYIYSGKFPEELDMQGLMGMYQYVKGFQTNSLPARCIQLIRSKAQLKDLVELMLSSEDLRDMQLMLIAVSLIRKDKDLVLNSEDWAEIMKMIPNRAKMALNFANSWMEF